MRRLLRDFLHDVMDEVVQVARAEVVELPADFARDRLAFCDSGPGHHDLRHEALEPAGRPNRSRQTAITGRPGRPPPLVSPGSARAA